MSDDLYRRAGIEDVEAFYRTKFVSDEVLDARYFRALDRFDIRFARTLWVYDNVRAGSAVLDLGCGAGMLALLKRKGGVLAGVDLSAALAAALRRRELRLRREPRRPRPRRVRGEGRGARGDPPRAPARRRDDARRRMHRPPRAEVLRRDEPGRAAPLPRGARPRPARRG